MTTERDLSMTQAGQDAHARRLIPTCWRLAATTTLALLLGACGGSDIVGQLTPTQVVSFGDGFTDLSTGAEWTVKDTAQPNVWPRQLALRYGLSGNALLSQADGGFGYGQGGAALACREDADFPCAGATSTLAEQVQAASSNGHLSVGAMAVVMMGATDGLHYAQLAEAGTLTDAQMEARMRAAAAAYVQQMRVLTQTGAKVVVVQLPKLGNSPEGLAAETLRLRLNAATVAFNREVLRLLAAVDNRIDGRDLAVVDGEFLFDLIVGDGGRSEAGFLTTRQPACGAGVTALDCTAAAPGASSSNWVFAAEVYPTPGLHRWLGDQVYDVVRRRF